MPVRRPPHGPNLIASRLISRPVQFTHGGLRDRTQHFDSTRNEGCDKAQGYLLGRPMPAGQIVPQAAAQRVAWPQSARVGIASAVRLRSSCSQSIKPRAMTIATAHRPNAKLVEWIVAIQPKNHGAITRGR